MFCYLSWTYILCSNIWLLWSLLLHIFLNYLNKKIQTSLKSPPWLWLTYNQGQWVKYLMAWVVQKYKSTWRSPFPTALNVHPLVVWISSGFVSQKFLNLEMLGKKWLVAPQSIMILLDWDAACTSDWVDDLTNCRLVLVIEVLSLLMFLKLFIGQGCKLARLVVILVCLTRSMGFPCFS